MQIIPYSLLNRYILLVIVKSFGCLDRKKYTYACMPVHTRRHTHVHTHTTHMHTHTTYVHTHIPHTCTHIPHTRTQRHTHTDIGHPGLMLPEVLSGTDAVSS